MENTKRQEDKNKYTTFNLYYVDILRKKKNGYKILFGKNIL